MSDRPIIFSAPMVLALLAGRKTQTRRLLKPQPIRLPGWSSAGNDGLQWPHGTYAEYALSDATFGPPYRSEIAHHCAPCAAGDRLWVRERLTRFQTYGAEHSTVHYPADNTGCCGRHGAVDCAADGRAKWPWKRDTIPSIHMPRWASRLTLAVADVRVQRLQDISEEDAEAEGASRTTCANVVSPPDGFPCFRSGFGYLWNSLHGPDAWSANPWVAALTFTVHRCNIDAMPSPSGAAIGGAA